MQKTFSRLTPLLKVLFGVGIVGWMAGTGKLNLVLVAKALSSWTMAVAILAIGYLQIGITTWRWHLLLMAQRIRLPIGRVWRLTMIGMAFNVVIPGAVGGDVIKAYYVGRAVPGAKCSAATTIVMDRAVGLIGLLLLGAVMALANAKDILASPTTRSLGGVILGGVVGGLLALHAAIFAGGRMAQLKFLPVSMRDVFSALHQYRRHSAVIPVVLLLSTLNQGLTCATYYLALRAVGISDLPFSQFFLVVPLGFIATAIPVSPAGIGVGQAAFFALFKMIAPRYASAGADALTVFQLMFVLVCLTGLCWYVSYKHIEIEPLATEG